MQDLEMFYLCYCKASRTVSSCIKYSRSSTSQILVLSTFISAQSQDFSHWVFFRSLCQASRRHCWALTTAGLWHQHGDIKTFSNVLLAGQHSLGSLEEYVKLSQQLNSLEYIPAMEISLAFHEAIWVFIWALAIVCPCSWTSQVVIFATPICSCLCSMQ